MTDQQYYRYRRTRMTAFMPETYQTVLDVGCGEGAFARQLEAGCEVWGIELNTNAANVAAKHMHTVLAGTFAEMHSLLPDKYFDVVICNDVIEHMENEEDFFYKIKEKMRDEGYLVASVPNVRHYKNLYELLVLKDWRYKEAGILDRTHLRFFTKKSLGIAHK